MPRGGKGARRGRGHFHPSASGGKRRGGLETSFVPFNGTALPQQNQDGFTLQQVAKNTAQHHAFGNPVQKLRHTKVNFVCAGTLDTRDEKDERDRRDGGDEGHAESALAEMSLDSPQQADMQMEGVTSEGRAPGAIPSTPPPNADEQQPAFVIDTLGSNPVDTGMAPPHVRAASPTPSNSSEEVILFRGRDRCGRGIPSRPRRDNTQTNTIDTRIKIIEDKIHEREELLEEVLHQKDPPVGSAQESSESFNSNIKGGKMHHGGRGGHRGRRSRTNNARIDDEDALLADYIANIDNEDSDLYDNPFHRRDLGGTDDDMWLGQTEESSGEPASGAWQPSHLGLGHPELYDTDGPSAFNGTKGDIERILSKSGQKSGVRYLVVWKNETVDEAQWVEASKLTSPNALAQLEEFETKGKLLAEEPSDSDDEDIDHESDDDDDDEEDDEDEDDDDLLQRRIDRMTDEQIARLLAKQEELGMGSDELKLFDAEADIEDDEDMGISRSAFSFAPIISTKKKPKARGAQRPRGEFPAASLLADAYDGFDVMDFERPSLKKKPKGRRGKVAFDLSDSELEASMEAAWDNDRTKKKERKQHREELRAQGLLGSKNGKTDLKAKYKEGMGIHAVNEEIKTFLMSHHTTISLPPMDKADRKIVHELANAFNLKSKSLGSGAKRFPVLCKTARTSVYVEGKFAAVEGRLIRRFLPRMDVGRKPYVNQRSGRGGGAGNGAASYRDGDIVGASAPELGVENKGRAMLEKMGWSMGTALGALNNKGILQPVSHVVKTTKAGLG
ncbi:uncharacterized protein BP5553_08928 [Venustampulla echinocandica]|uniref:Protein SQS1 n=1 Tax=Venustampulla echinocandica TaxID=2656787 RepID=A0A370TDE9_9HELO|nr:uncharacterized protein BP5553_08928 [Venustampulla echinocandica]RDL32472.1 hypothetical protein BP5553_08928 [Venustampulla echinocandica]